MTKNNDDEQVILEFGVQTFTLTDYTRYQEIRVCNRCGRSFIPRSHASDPKCPHCSSTRTTNDNRCPFCGMEWSSVGDWSACPRCGKERQGSDRSAEIWSDGMMSR